MWAIIFKAPLEEPERYMCQTRRKLRGTFLAYRKCCYFDPWMAGVVLPGIILAGLILIPYIDTNPKGNGYYTFAERPRFDVYVWLASSLNYLTMWGHFTVQTGHFMDHLSFGIFTRLLQSIT